MASTSGVLVDDHVLEVLRKAQLDNFVNKFVFLFNVRRFDHFSHVRDKDMQDIGMQQQQIRQLREQVLKMSRELWNRSDPKQVYVAADQSTPVQSIDERALIPNEQIKLYEMLGEGSFAVVKRGTWTQSNGQHVDVAVKILRDISPNIMDDLRVEASHLLKLQHPSLIRLYGIVRQPAMMVFELCEGGSLLDRLRDDKKSILLVSRLHDYCMQIAKALQFLESKHCVHRDVAARNILLAKDEKTVKICDFGLMRALKENEQMYTMGPQKKVPFAWCPPEALRHRKFSHASDVWSYGVTVWELFTYGEEPWVGCRAIDVLKNIDAGERLEKPKYCSERIYQIMQNCWKSNPAERCKFGAIREDLKAAMFLDAIAREAYTSIQPGTLQLVKGDEVVVVENTGQDWFGQNKKNQKFGTFPRTVVFAQTNHAVAADTAVTPQKVPTAPTIKVQQRQAPPPPMPSFSAKPLNNNSITSVNNRTSKISMPVAGNESMISNVSGRNDSGNFVTNYFVDAPKAKDPTFDIRGNVLMPTPVEKVQIPPKADSTRPILIAPTSSGMISMQLPDTFTTSQPHSSIGKSRMESEIHSTRPTSSRQETRTIPSSQPSTNFQHLPSNFIPELQTRINVGNDVGSSMRPRPASSIGVQNPPAEAYGAQVPRPFSVVNVPSQPAQIPCLVPTPAPASSSFAPKSSINQPTQMQRALADELKGNLSKRPTNVVAAPPGQRNGVTSSSSAAQQNVPPVQQHKPLQPQQVRLPPPVTQAQIAPTQIAPTSIAPTHAAASQRVPTSVAPTAVAPKSTPTQSQTAPAVRPPASSQPAQKPTIPATQTTSASTNVATSSSSQNVVTRRPTSTINMTDEERRSKIISDMSSALPAPSALLLGSNSNSTPSLPSSFPSAMSAPPKERVAQIPAASQPQVTMPPQKRSEPILSTEVLQPTRLPSSSTSVAHPTAIPAQQPARNPSPPVITNRQTTVADKKPAVPSQSTNVPLYNITNSSSIYPQLNGYPNYGNGYQPYGYGMNYNPGYPYVSNGYNPYMSGMGQLALTQNAVTSLPPLTQSENRFSGTAQQLGESDIRELLGTQNREPSAPPLAPSSTTNSARTNDLSMVDRMEVLYREASFTDRGNCDSMVSQCNGDTEIALKKLKVQHLVTLGLAENLNRAEQALQSCQYDLAAAANLLIG